MKKRLFCLLMVAVMLSSSMAVYAAEPAERTKTEGEASEEDPAGLKEDGIKEAEKTPDVIPETGEEADKTPEETRTPDAEVEATASPDIVPTTEPEEGTGAEPTETPVVIPSEKPEVIPETEPTVSPTLLPQESISPEMDGVVDVTPSPSMSPTPSASPTASPVEILVPEDELVGATTYNGDLIIDQTTVLTENWTINGDLIILNS